MRNLTGKMLQEDKMHGIRPMQRGDIAQVAQLFLHRFRNSSHCDQRIYPPLSSDPDDFHDYLEELLFESPYYHRDHGSMVYIGPDDEILSAILCIPMAFSYRGQNITGRLLCAFMARENGGKLAAAQLSRYMRADRHDFLFSDNSSPVSLDHWITEKGQILPLQSLDWERDFYPFMAFFYRWRHRIPSLLHNVLGVVLKPLDRLVHKKVSSFVLPMSREMHILVIQQEDFRQFANEQMAGFEFRPVWDRNEFDWLVSMARKNHKLGNLIFCQIRDQSNQLIGVFAFMGRTGGVAHLFHCFYLPGKGPKVYQAMLGWFANRKYCTLKGIANTADFAHLTRQKRVVFCAQSYFCVASRHNGLLDALDRNNLFLGGLVSEYWSRLTNDF